MFAFNMRISPRLVRQVAAIERFAGRWDRISESPVLASEELSTTAIAKGSRAAFLLDSTSPTELTLYLRHSTHNLQTNSQEFATFGDIATTHADIERYIRASIAPFDFSWEGISSLASAIGVSNSHELRRIPVNFSAPAEYEAHGALSDRSAHEELVFACVSPFLIDQRLRELISWLQQELTAQTFHPLFLIGTFHLLLLQIHPFPTANHRFSLLVVWHLLCERGFSFVRYTHIAPAFWEKRRQYFQALRQAEKSARADWATVNSWLELFLQSLEESGHKLWVESGAKENRSRLTEVQKLILEVVREHGALTREKIAGETGIHLSTVKYNLGVLSDRGHLKRQGGGRTTNYRLL